MKIRKETMIMLMIVMAVFLSSRAKDIFAGEIHQAARKGDLAAIKMLLEKNPALIDIKDSQGSTPLHYAAALGNEEVVKLLLERGANIDAGSSAGDTPLHWAAYSDRILIVGLLIDKGARIDAVNPNGVTPLHMAASAGHVNAAELLIDRGANINAKNIFGDTPLHWAVFYGHKGMVDLLVAKGVAVDAKSSEGRFFLHEGAAGGHEKLVGMLLQKGADIKSENNNGGSLLHSAASGALTDIIEMAIKNGLGVNARDRYGLTPLHYGAANGYANVVELLTRRGADINPRAFDGRTPFNMAIDAGKQAAADLLIAKGADNSPKKFPVLKGECLGQKTPGLTPVIFAPGIVSTPAIDFACAFSPDGTTFYFTRFDLNSMKTVIMMMGRENHRWSEPQTAPFSGQYSDFEAFVSYDGKKLYFCSNRPLKKEGILKDQDIWVIEKTAAGWSAPENPGPPLNSNKEELYPTLTRDGTVYFRSDREGGLGLGDLYRAKVVDGVYAKPENLGNMINTEFDELNAFISPDGGYIIFASRGRPDCYGGNDLYISFRKPDGTWTPAKNMGDQINSPKDEYTPIVSPDGKFLFFTSAKKGNDDIYWLSAKIIENFRKG